MKLSEIINARLHLVENNGELAQKQYYDQSGWVGGEIPVPREFKRADGTVKDDLGQIDWITGPQYDYPKGSYIRGSKQPAPGWADINPQEVLNSQEIKAEHERAKRGGYELSPYNLREAARIKKILIAIRPHVYSVLRGLAAKYPQFSIDDMAANAFLNAAKVLRSQLDQAKDGNKFLTWLTPNLEVGANHGTGGGAEHRAAVGDINRLVSARRPEQVMEILGKISPENREHNNETPRTRPGNPYGQFTPIMAKLADRLVRAMDPENPSGEDVVAIRNELERLKEKTVEDADGIKGAKTGFMKGGISIAHSGDDTWKNFVKNVKVGSTHVTGSDGNEIEKPDIATGKAGGYGVGERANFKDEQMWPDLHDASPDQTETFKAALEFAMQQYLASLDEGEPEFKLTPGIQAKLAQELQVNLPSVKPLDLQQIRYVCRKLGLRNYPTKGQTYDLEFDKNKYKAMVTELTGKGMSEAQARTQAIQACASGWVRAGCPTMDSKIDMAARNRYKELGTEPEIPSLRDAAPLPVNPQTWAGAGAEGPVKNIKHLEDAMKTFGIWYWLYSKYEMNESTNAVDRAIVEAGWQIYRKAVIKYMLRECDMDTDCLSIMVYG